MFMHMNHPEQTRRVAELMQFHADHREPGTRVSISSHGCEGAFEDCIVFETSMESPAIVRIDGVLREHATETSVRTSDRIVIAPDGSTLHLT